LDPALPLLTAQSGWRSIGSVDQAPSVPTQPCINCGRATAAGSPMFAGRRVIPPGEHDKAARKMVSGNVAAARASARLWSTIVVLLLSAGVALSACSLFESRSVVCDGVWPRWVLDRQGYNGGGCVEMPAGGVPADQAPPNADWTPINTGYGECPNGSLYIDGNCTVVPSDRPWPSSAPYVPDARSG
jgi:hypothetical protein